jgi:hypothetical protein
MDFKYCALIKKITQGQIDQKYYLKNEYFYFEKSSSFVYIKKL